MRPGEQQPGGEPAREWSNPYQQPGYTQSNPYQQPPAGDGWQQPPGAAQPGAGWQQPPPPPGGPGAAPPPPGGGDNSKRTKIAVGIVVAVAVVAGAAVTGVVLLGGDDDSSQAGDSRDAPGPSEEPSEEPTDEPTEEETERPNNPDDPRRGVLQRPDPVIAPDWQVQTLENRHIAFDVPPEDWTVNSESMSYGIEDDREEAEEGDILVAMSGVAVYMDDWCENSRHGVSSRAMTGTKGAQGATNTAEAAENEAMNWALGGYDQHQTGTFEMTEPEEFESDYGISGHIVRATVTDVPEDPDDPKPCGQTDGKVVTVSYLDLNNDMATWVMMADAGIPEELDDDVIEQILSSLRPYPVESEQS
ncbi:hypothetical protein [Streptomyces profundus]|uniref:hypothetical protein n=1 Tax=Streptomyces profundus TaxID=2867410 RepID=UPI001D1693EC|nr:hypothetical protein [Streptomyces sp. MA3_2.13]UED82854.1 hypothetical protein K4G22_00510 [Streptomyces sp. MA3_2.13]